MDYGAASQADQDRSDRYIFKYQPFRRQCTNLSKWCFDLNAIMHRVDDKKKEYILNAFHHTVVALEVVSDVLTTRVAVDQGPIHETHKALKIATDALEICLFECEVGIFMTQDADHVPNFYLTWLPATKVYENEITQDHRETWVSNQILSLRKLLDATNSISSSPAIGERTKDETPPFGSQKPWSLFEDLTRPLADPRPPSSLIIPLIHALGRDACVATRNALQLYEIISKARDLGDTVNELVMLVYVSDEAAVLRSAKDKYMELERNLRSVLKRLAQVTKDESNPLSIKSIRTWEPNRTLYQTSMQELKSMSLDVKQHKGCLPTQMSWTNATEIDDTEWLARLCRDINLRRNNHDALLNVPSEGGYSRSCSSTFDKIAIDLQQLELSLRLLPERRESLIHLVIHCAMTIFAMKEVAHLEPDVWEEAAIIISDVKTYIESQNHPLSFPAVLHRWYDFEARWNAHIAVSDIGSSVP